MSQRSGFSGSLWAHLARPGPLLAVLYGGEGELTDTLDAIELLADAPCRRENSIDTALNLPDSLVLLTVPLDQQVSVIDRLEVQRDSLIERRQPLILLLFRDGAGVGRLFRSPFLASWLRGRILDPERLASIDLEPARAEFARQAGCDPETFLRQWSDQELADTLDNNLLHQQALLLAQEER